MPSEQPLQSTCEPPVDLDSDARALAASDRRGFLGRMGLAACASMAVVAHSEQPALAQGRAQKKGPAPTSGLKGIKELLARKEPVMWVFTGDSITHGALHTKGWRSYPEHFAERVRWELKRMRDIVVNTGVSGEQATGLLADIDWRILHLKPDVVSVMLGMNDCTLGAVAHELFRKNLTVIVTRIITAGAIPILNTPNAIYVKNDLARQDLPGYAKVVREVAEATKSVLVDHYTHWSEAKPDPEQLLTWLEDKSIHPNYLGHRELAREIFRQLEIFDENSPTCQLEV